MMKFLMVALSALALASAQTVTTNLELSLAGNDDGSATITVGTGPGVTIPANVVTAAKAIIGLINTAVAGVSPGSTTDVTLPISLDRATGTVSVTFGGNTYTLDRTTFATVMALQKQLFQALIGALPRPIRGHRGHREGGRHGHRRG